MAPYRIGIHAGIKDAYFRDVTRGVIAYCRTHGLIEELCDLQANEFAVPVEQLQGYVASMHHPVVSQSLLQRGVPIVNITGGADTDTVTVRGDGVAQGRLAAEHLLNLGLVHFGFHPRPLHHEAERRQQGFVDRIAEAGYEVNVFQRPGDPTPQAVQEGTVVWLKSLPKPVGLFAWNDYRCYSIAKLCLYEGIATPEEAALIGCDNDELLCESGQLSSVDPSAHQIGYQAADLLHRMIQGHQPRHRTHIVPPRGVVSRRSTDMLAVPDPIVAAALRYIRLHAIGGIGVDGVLREIPLSRRTLERRFRQVVGRSPGQEIDRIRVDHARKLLASSTASLEEVAALSGFSGARQLGDALRRLVGVSPSDYRESCRQSVGV